MANENKRMLCGPLSIVGFLIIITQKRKFSKNDKAAIAPNIVSLALAWELSSLFSGFGVEMLRVTETVLLSGYIFDSPT